MDEARSSAPLLKATVVLMGMSMLAPFNTLVTASEYFRAAFANDPILASGFSSGMMALFNATSVVCGLVAALSGSHGGVNMARRSQWALLFLCAAMSIALISVLVRPIGAVSQPYLYYAMLLALSMALALGMAVYQSATMALCVQLDHHGELVGLVLTGQAAQGVASSLVGFLGVVLANRMPGTSHALDNQRAALALFSTTLALLVVTRLLMNSQLKHYDASASRNSQTQRSSQLSDVLKRIWAVQQRLWRYSLAVMLVFGLTLTLYPAFSSLVRPHMKVEAGVFVALHYILFNVGDLVGRRLPAFSPRLMLNRSQLIVFSIARLAFLPLVCSANVVKPRGADSCFFCVSMLPDIGFIVTIFMLGLTTGWGATCIMVGGPAHVAKSGELVAAESVEDGTDVEAEGLLDTRSQSGDSSVAALLLTLQLVTALTIGSVLSLSLVM